jgi:selenium metabolism protein YedF
MTQLARLVTEHRMDKMVKTVDARGLPCPQPVLLTKKAMGAGEAIITLVTGRDQVGNVRRLAERDGWQVRVEEQEGGFAVHLAPPQAGAPEPQPAPQAQPGAVATGPTVVVLSGERMGRGDDELGGILMRTFFHTLTEVEPLPDVLIFYNTGVRLAVEGSPVLDDLRVLEEQGVQLLVCGTCLGYFDLKEQLAVGVISNMYTIAETLLDAGRVLNM